MTINGWNSLCLASLLLVFSLSIAARGADIDVWLGTSQSALSKGIYHCTLNNENGRLTEARLVAEIRGPGFLAMHPKLPLLYAVGTLDNKASVVAYHIVAGANGRKALELMGATEIGDGGAAHLAIDSTGQTLLTAQYNNGSVAAFALSADGMILQRKQIIKHAGGSKVGGKRQDSPHPHWVGFSPNNRFAFVPDLGLDQVVIYRVDVAAAMLTPHGVAALPPGAGPRHMKIHPTGKWIYVLHELDLSVSVFAYDADAGTMTRKQTVPTVPKEDWAREQTASGSEIRIHPSGKFVYAANRGHDTITLFRVQPQSGELEVVERTNVRGATPRNFNLDPSARWLLTAGQDSHTLASFAVNAETGTLTYNQSIIHAPSPICVLFGNE